MVFILLIRWWYGAGWAGSFAAIFNRVSLLSADLSMGILVTTLFEPWKQITLYAGNNASLDTKVHVLFDNVFSRAFGFVVRSVVLLIGCIMITATLLFGVLLAIAWPIVPILPIVFIFLAVM